MSQVIVDTMLDDITSALSGFEVVARTKSVILLRGDTDFREYVITVTPVFQPEPEPASPEEGQEK